MTRFLIGIDLGTTNSAVSFVDLEKGSGKGWPIQSFAIPQIGSALTVVDELTLPSFCYLPASFEVAQDKVRLPWEERSDWFVGIFAEERAREVPGRVVQSAKSWLSHQASARKNPILPETQEEGVQKISPVVASSRFLEHIKRAWNFMMAKSDQSCVFEEQSIVVTVPASFDEVARQLTVQAAQMAGFKNFTLLEEPMAAFYSWISTEKDESILQDGDLVVVVDVGGGTTDFSLIRVHRDSEGLAFSREQVGDHLLLGGDNMDWALVNLLEENMGGEFLEFRERLSLKAECKRTKEKLLSKLDAADYLISIQGKGKKVIGKTQSFLMQQEKVMEALNAFFPLLSWDEAQPLTVKPALKTTALPYESEPAITRHLGSFLKKSLRHNEFPKAVLFNGGALKPKIFRDKIVQSLTNWFNHPCFVLESCSLDSAVARGAAYFAKAKLGLGKRVRGGIAKSLFLEVEDEGKKRALTLVTRGEEMKEPRGFPHTFWLKTNQPALFPLLSSSTRLEDSHSTLVDLDLDTMQRLPPLSTWLTHKGSLKENKIPVSIEVQQSDIGTLEMRLVSLEDNGRWQLEFLLKEEEGRIKEGNALDERLDESSLKEIKTEVSSWFQSTAQSNLVERLEKIVGKAKGDFPLSVLRTISDSLIQQNTRSLNKEHLEKYWNLLGFCLRPGFGFPLDEVRVKKVWQKLLEEKQDVPLGIEIQLLILLRRLSGGFNRGMQMQLASPIMNATFDQKSGQLLKERNRYLQQERIRTLASFEYLETAWKQKLGTALLKKIREGDGGDVEVWALGRMGARALLYAPQVFALPPKNIQVWIEDLLKDPLQNADWQSSLLFQWSRRSLEREGQLNSALFERVKKSLANMPEGKKYFDQLEHNLEMTIEEKEAYFLDSLPIGLELKKS